MLKLYKKSIVLINLLFFSFSYEAACVLRFEGIPDDLYREVGLKYPEVGELRRHDFLGGTRHSTTSVVKLAGRNYLLDCAHTWEEGVRKGKKLEIEFSDDIYCFTEEEIKVIKHPGYNKDIGRACDFALIYIPAERQGRKGTLFSQRPALEICSISLENPEPYRLMIIGGGQSGQINKEGTKIVLDSDREKLCKRAAEFEAIGALRKETDLVLMSIESLPNLALPGFSFKGDSGGPCVLIDSCELEKNGKVVGVLSGGFDINEPSLLIIKNLRGDSCRAGSFWNIVAPITPAVESWLLDTAKHFSLLPSSQPLPPDLPAASPSVWQRLFSRPALTH